MTKPTLRSRESLEKEILTQIALGTIKSFDDGFHEGNPTILEYFAQSWLKLTREKVSSNGNLPLHVAVYLMFDKTARVCANIVRLHWDKFTNGQQTSFIHREIEEIEDLGRNEVLEQVLSKIICNPVHDKNASIIVDTIGSYDIWKLENMIISSDSSTIDHFRQVPLTCAAVYDVLIKENVFPPLSIILVHPKEDLRVKEFERLLSKDSKELHNILNGNSSVVYNRSNELLLAGANKSSLSIKSRIHLLIAADPSLKVGQLVFKNTNCPEVLRKIAANFLGTPLAAAAIKKAEKMEKRRRYSQDYRDKQNRIIRCNEKL